MCPRTCALGLSSSLLSENKKKTTKVCEIGDREREKNNKPGAGAGDLRESSSFQSRVFFVTAIWRISQSQVWFCLAIPCLLSRQSSSLFAPVAR